MSPIEAMARAMATSDGVYAWDSLSERSQGVFKREARAALSALADNVSERMIGMGTASLTGDGCPDPDYADDAKGMFRAMCAAAGEE